MSSNSIVAGEFQTSWYSLLRPSSGSRSSHCGLQSRRRISVQARTHALRCFRQRRRQRCIVRIDQRQVATAGGNLKTLLEDNAL
jgi:hypothetical protein